MGVLGFLHAHAGTGFHAGMIFRASAPSSPSSLRTHTPPPTRPLPPAAWSPPPSSSGQRAAASTTRRTRRFHPRCRSYSSLFASVGDGETPPPGDSDVGAPGGQGQRTPGSSEDEMSAAAAAGDGGGEATPEPRADEQASGDLQESGVAEDGGSGGGDEVDWDKAWASTRQRMANEKRAAPAFSGRKQVVASKNDEGGYDFEEIAADGSSRMRGGKGSGGFGFADSSEAEGADGPGRVRRQEQEAVNLATTNQAFAGLFAVLVFSLIFEIYVYMTGGITNGSTRFLEMGQPTVYDALPLPPVPTPEDDLTV